MAFGTIHLRLRQGEWRSAGSPPAGGELARAVPEASPRGWLGPSIGNLRRRPPTAAAWLYRASVERSRAPPSRSGGRVQRAAKESRKKQPRLMRSNLYACLRAEFRVALRSRFAR